jgi:hypothetical protein
VRRRHRQELVPVKKDQLRPIIPTRPVAGPFLSPTNSN